MANTISMAQIKDMINKGVSTFSRKDSSPRGVETVSALDIKVGDKVVLDNHFTLIVDEIIFENLEEAQRAVDKVLGDIKAIFTRRDTYSNDNTEVICISQSGVYWMVKFYDDGDIGYGIMSYGLEIEDAISI